MNLAKIKICHVLHIWQTDVLTMDILARMFWPGRFGQHVLATDILARYRYKVGCFGHLPFQHGKALYELFMLLYIQFM